MASLAPVHRPSAGHRCAATASCAVRGSDEHSRAPSRAEHAAASVAPEVKTTSAGLQPTASATCARARSTSALAARPSAWTEDGLPTTSIAATIAARASGRSGAVAFQSR